jgi:hypothetical protein
MSTIEYNGRKYLVMSESEDALVLSQMGPQSNDSRLGNAPIKAHGSVTGRFPMDDPSIVSRKPLTVTASYTPPEGEATMKVYCLVGNKTDKRHWYVNKSTTKSIMEGFMEPAQFMEFDVPKTKAGLIHFLNKVCG